MEEDPLNINSSIVSNFSENPKKEEKKVEELGKQETIKDPLLSQLPIIEEEKGDISTTNLGRLLSIFTPILILIVAVFFCLILGVVIYSQVTRSVDYSNPYRVVKEIDYSPIKRSYLLENYRYRVGYGNNNTFKNSTRNNEPLFLNATLSAITDHVLRVKITDQNLSRYEMPELTGFSDPEQYLLNDFQHFSLEDIGCTIDKKVFEYELTGRQNTKYPILSTKSQRLWFFDKYIEMEAVIYSNYLFGLGDSNGHFRLIPSHTYTFWNSKNSTSKYDTLNSQSSHPFVLIQLSDDQFMGIYMRTANAMQVYCREFKEYSILRWQITGGILDYYVFFGGDAHFILKQFHSLIGFPYIPPFWSLGFHYGNSSFLNSQDILNQVSNFKKNLIPLDAVWTETNINTEDRIFTLNPNFHDLLKAIISLHNDPNNINYVTTILPSIEINPNYNYSQIFSSKMLAVRECDQRYGLFEGACGNYDCYIADFSNKDIINVWEDALLSFHNSTEFDGISIRNNEPKVIGIHDFQDTIPECHFYDYLPYIPVNLTNDTLPLNAKFLNNMVQTQNQSLNQHFNMHNIYPLLSVNITNVATSSSGKKTFLTSESTSSGTGHYASFLGKTSNSSYSDMQKTIQGVINMNLFGIPHSGYFIGGEEGSLSDILVIRWFQLGAFFPLSIIFSNSKNNDRNIFARKPDTLAIIKNAISLKYSLLRFYYTKMFESFLWGGPIVYPLFFDFKSDNVLMRETVIDTTFTIGGSIYVVPILSDEDHIDIYLPNSNWYDLLAFNQVASYGPGGSKLSKAVNASSMFVFAKGGTIIPYQKIPNSISITSKNLLAMPISILVFPDHLGSAIGSLIFDSENIMPSRNPSSNTYRHYSINYFEKVVRFNKIGGFNNSNQYNYEFFNDLLVFINNSLPSPFACMLDDNLNFINLDINLVGGNYYNISVKNNGIKVPFYHIESISFGANDSDYNPCNQIITIKSSNYSVDKKIFRATLSQDSNTKHDTLTISLNAKLIQDNILSIQMKLDDDKNPWIVPDVVPDEIRNRTAAINTLDTFGFVPSSVGQPFSFKILSADKKFTILNTEHLLLRFSQRFKVLQWNLSSSHIFGLGERVANFDLGDGIYSLFSHAVDSPVETGKPPGNNMYGEHPFYMFQLDSNFHFAAVFLLTSNALDVSIKKGKGSSELTHYFSGGIFDIFIISSGTADYIIKLYHYLIGKPVLLPYWAFGFHQSRWGYDSIEKLKTVFDTFQQKHLPFDSLWSDIDYMYKYQNFIVNNASFKELDLFVDSLNEADKSWVAIVDSGISKNASYSIYNDALQTGCLINSSKNNSTLVGIMWPGYVVYPDFLHPQANSFWSRGLEMLRNQAFYSGIWIDMNEAYNFCDGECSDETSYTMKYYPSDIYNTQIYLPTHRQLDKKGISMNGYHEGFNKNSTKIEFNYHSMFGFYESKATYFYFANVKKERAFILSRSTFPGSNKYSSHWLGDTFSDFSMMKYSIPGIMNFNLFGFLHTGSDVCGFMGNYSYELCARWYQLGAFYPFFRSHNSIGYTGKEPYVEPNLEIVYRNAIQLRYSLLKYIFTTYIDKTINGGPLFQPYLFEFPEDEHAYKYLDQEFMLGPAILIAPVLDPNLNTLNAYLPNANWYNLEGNQVVSHSNIKKTGEIVKVICTLPNSQVPIFFRGGYAIPIQNASRALGVYDMKGFPTNIHIYADQNMNAVGYAYFDEDELDTFTTGRYHYFKFNFTGYTITFTQIFFNPNYPYIDDPNDEIIGEIIIFGTRHLREVKCARLNDTRQPKLIILQAKVARMEFDEYKVIISMNPAQKIEIDFKYTRKIELEMESKNC